MSKHIPYESLKISNKSFFEAYQEKSKKIIESGWYILGSELESFENAFAGYIGVKHCIGLASGLDALILALMALDLPPHSEVLVAANAYVACILSIERAGHIPVLIEPNISTSNIDVSKLEEKITKNTRAIMPVHLYGYPCEMEVISALAKKHHLHIIEDCAQAHGAHYFGQKVGTFSTVSAFSFFPTKNLGALGDAGACLTNDDALATKLRALRNYGSHIKYHNDYIGINSRLDELQAGFLNVKLPHLDLINDHKRNLAKLYDQNLDNRFQKPHHALGYHGVYHIYNIYTSQRDQLKKYLSDNNILTEIHYPIPPYRQKALKERFDENAYPVSDKMHQSTLSLPLSYGHTTDDILRVCEVINQFF